MKYLINQSKLKLIILKYLDREFEPDFGWVDHEYYQNELDETATVLFYVNDDLRYYFELNNLYIFSDDEEKLNSLFGDKWLPIFIEWFESHTGLNVEKNATF